MRKKVSLLLSIIFIATSLFPNIVAFANEESNLASDKNSLDYKDMTQEELEERINKLFDDANSDVLTIESDANKNSKNKYNLRGDHPYVGGDKVQLSLRRDIDTLTCRNVTTGAVYTCNYLNSYAGYNCGARDSIGCFQGLLNCNYYALAVDGIFGNNTYNAVVDFQRRRNLDVDGIAGPKTFSVAVLITFEKSLNV